MSVPEAECWQKHSFTLANTWGLTECCGYQALCVLEPHRSPRLLGSALPGNVLHVARLPGDDPRCVVEEGCGQVCCLTLSLY